MSPGKKRAKKMEFGRNHECIHVEEPQNHDVVCGRGGIGVYHTGNCLLRKLIASLKPTYLRASRSEKMRMITSVVLQWPKRYPPGRFLKQETSSGLWICLTEREIKKKVGQLLREGAPSLRHQVHISEQVMMQPEEKVHECMMRVTSSSLPLLPDFSCPAASSKSSCHSHPTNHHLSSASSSCSGESSTNIYDEALQEDEKFLFKPSCNISENLYHETKNIHGAACNVNGVIASKSTTSTTVSSHHDQNTSEDTLLEAAKDYVQLLCLNEDSNLKSHKQDEWENDKEPLEATLDFDFPTFPNTSHSFDAGSTEVDGPSRKILYSMNTVEEQQAPQNERSHKPADDFSLCSELLDLL